MSLRVWLPLNNNTNNYGIDGDITITNQSTKTYSTGKTCAKAALISNYINIPISNFGNTVSIAFWVKPTSPSAWTDIISFGSVSNRFEKSTTTAYYWYCNDSTYGLISSGTSIMELTDSTWVHIAIVADGTNVKFYKDGVLAKTMTQLHGFYESLGTSANLRICGRIDGSCPYNGYMNDFRLYDHPLSLKQVLDIARGMVLHYKLDSLSGRTGNPNLLLHSGLYNPIVHTSSAKNGYKSYCIYANGLSTSKTYTLSCECDGTLANQHIPSTIDYTKKQWAIWLYQNDSAYTDSSYSSYKTPTVFTSSTSTYKKVDNRYTWTFTPSYANVAIRVNTYSDGTNSVTINLSNIKLEEGSVATDWCPHTSDAAYNSLGFAKGVVDDCSGFSNDATIMNTPVLSTQSRIYDSCVWTNSTGYIKNTSLNLTATNISISFWVNPIKESSKVQHFLFGTFSSWTGNGIGMYADNTNSDYRTYSVLYKGDSASSYKSALQSALQYTCGTWHFVTLTYDGTNIYYYYNGALYATIAYAGGTITNPNIYIGNSMYNSTPTSETENVLINDFRIYATTLSAEAVRQLYKVRASIDKINTLYANKFKELTTGNPNFEKTGIGNAIKINENDLKYDTNIYREADGSCWVRIFHHNNPASYLFSLSNSFTTSVYIDSNRWFNMAYCNSCGDNEKWELMIKQKPTSDGTESKYRWIQTANPMTATYASVASSSVTKISTDGYTTSSYGGLYKKVSSTYICANNGNSGNWWGAIGDMTIEYNNSTGAAGITVTSAGSLTSTGNICAKGSICVGKTFGGGTTITGGCNQTYNSTTQSLEFTFE